MTLDENVRRFIASHIHSVEQLEVLLLLHREPQREWTASEVSAALASTPYSVESRLLDLTARRLAGAREIAGELRYRYDPGPDLEPIVCALAAVYLERRTTVITLIFSKPLDNVRTLADAFIVGDPRRRPGGDR